MRRSVFYFIILLIGYISMLVGWRLWILHDFRGLESVGCIGFFVGILTIFICSSLVIRSGE